MTLLHHVVCNATCCDGPYALPRDARALGGGVMATNHPEIVKKIHTEGCKEK